MPKQFIANFHNTPESKYQFRSATELLSFALLQCKSEWIDPTHLLKSIQEEVNDIYFDPDYYQSIQLFPNSLKSSTDSDYSELAESSVLTLHNSAVGATSNL